MVRISAARLIAQRIISPAERDAGRNDEDAIVTAVLAFVLMLVIVAGMAVGVMFGRKPIAGSCGGMKALGMNVECEICGGNPQACDSAPESARSRSERASSAAAALAVDANRNPRKDTTRSL